MAPKSVSPRLSFVLLVLAGLLLVSSAVPSSYSARGQESVSLDLGFSTVGKEVTLAIRNFPPNVGVEIRIGGYTVTSRTTDANGSADVKVKVPELPSGTHLVQARHPPKGIVASTQIFVQSSLRLFDSKGVEITSSTYVPAGSLLRVVGNAFASLDDVKVFDDGTGTTRNVIEAGLVKSVVRGVLSSDKIVSDALGTFDFTYTITIDRPTGTIIGVRAQGRTAFELRDFLAQGKAGFTAAFPLAAQPASLLELQVPTHLTGLAPNERYAILIDGSPSSMTVDGRPAQSFTSANFTVRVNVPSLPTGLHTLSVARLPTLAIESGVGMVLSRPSTAPTPASLLLLQLDPFTSLPTGSALTNAVVQESVRIVILDAIPNESVAAFITSAESAAVSLGSMTVDSNGVGSLISTIPITASGTYSVYLTRSQGVVLEVTFNIIPKLSLSVAEASPGEGVSLTGNGLEPTTSYFVVWNIVPGSSTGGETLAKTLFTTDIRGSATQNFEVPSVSAGVYHLSVRRADSPTLAVLPKANPKLNVTYKLKFDRPQGYVAGEHAGFSWDTVTETAGKTARQVVVKINDQVALFGNVTSEAFVGNSAGVSLEWKGTVLSGSFIFPNGEPNQPVKLQIAFAGKSVTAITTRIAGPGSLGTGPEVGQGVTRIETGVAGLKEALTALEARLLTLRDNIAILDTNIGKVALQVGSASDLLDKKLASGLTAVQELITRTQGDVRRAIDAAAAKSAADISKVESRAQELGERVSTAHRDISKLGGDLETIRTDVASRSSRLEASVSSVGGSVTGVSSALNTVLLLTAVAIAAAIAAAALAGVAARR